MCPWTFPNCSAAQQIFSRRVLEATPASAPMRSATTFASTSGRSPLGILEDFDGVQ